MTSDDETPKKNLNPLEGLERDDDDLSNVTSEDLEDIDEIDDIIEASPLGSELDQEDFSGDEGGGDDFAAELSAMPTDGDDMPSFDSDDGDYIEKKSGGMKKMLAPALVLVIAAGAAGYIMMNPGVLSGLTGGSVVEAPAKPAFDVQADAAKRKAANEALAKAQAAAAKKQADAQRAKQMAAKNAALEKALPQPTGNMNGDGQMAKSDGGAAMKPNKAINDLLAAGDEMKSKSKSNADTDAKSGGVDMAAKDGGDAPAFSNDLPKAVSVETPKMKKEPVNDVTEESMPRPPMSDLVATPEDKDMKVARADKVEGKAPEEKMTAEKAVKQTDAAKSGSDDAENNIFEEDFQDISGDKSPEKTAVPAKKPEQKAASSAKSEGDDAYYDSDITVPGAQVSGIRELNPRIEPATKFVVAVENNKKNDQESLVVAANRAIKLRRYDAARDMFEQLYAKNKRDKRILMGLAVAQQNTGRPEAAIKTYEELLDIDPDNADAMVNMLGLIRAQYPSVALRRLLDLQDKHPGNAGIAAQIGVTQADLGHYDEAVRYLTRAATLAPQNPQHVFNLAIVTDRQGKTKQAIDYYQQALEVDTVYGGGKALPHDTIYDRLATLRRR